MDAPETETPLPTEIQSKRTPRIDTRHRIERAVVPETIRRGRGDRALIRRILIAIAQNPSNPDRLRLQAALGLAKVRGFIRTDDTTPEPEPKDAIDPRRLPTWDDRK